MTKEERIRCALIDLRNIESNRQLLKGHFSLVAKRHGVKSTDLKDEYAKQESLKK